MENAFFVEFPTMETGDLHVNNFGYSVTNPCHKYGPAVRSFYLIHYILEGRGEFCTDNNRYPLTKGQGFLIEPDYQTEYRSDADDPWTYVWVGFSGKKAKDILNSIGISQAFPVFTCEDKLHPEQYVKDMLRHNSANTSDLYRQTAMLYLFFSCLTKANKSSINFESRGNVYVAHAIRYIQNHYSEPIRIEELARYVGLNRSYLSTLFKKHTGLSPLKYLQTHKGRAPALYDPALHRQHCFLLRLSGAGILSQNFSSDDRSLPHAVPCEGAVQVRRQPQKV